MDNSYKNKVARPFSVGRWRHSTPGEPYNTPSRGIWHAGCRPRFPSNYGVRELTSQMCSTGGLTSGELGGREGGGNQREVLILRSSFPAGRQTEQCAPKRQRCALTSQILVYSCFCWTARPFCRPVVASTSFNRPPSNFSRQTATTVARGQPTSYVLRFRAPLVEVTYVRVFAAPAVARMIPHSSPVPL